jgi:hypothetical protein
LKTRLVTNQYVGGRNRIGMNRNSRENLRDKEEADEIQGEVKQEKTDVEYL